VVYLFADNETEARDILKRYVEDHATEIVSPELCQDEEIHGPTLMKAFPVEAKKGVAEGVSYFPKASDFEPSDFTR
jgi:hypothetical protein